MTDRLIDEASRGVNTPEFSVSDISVAVKRMIEGEFGHVRIRGEVGRISRPRSGHLYLDLKDDRSVLAAVVWKAAVPRLGLDPDEGDEVIATGRLTTFPGQSKYQLVIESLSYAGAGALLARLERLKAQLAAEGLFAAERKRAIPYLPRVIGVVTSPSGAVIRDILHRLADRFPVRVLVWPVVVQGPACAGEVAAALRGFSALEPGGPVPRPDVVIVARGGGSVEDLWGFNEEVVVRAVVDSTIPVISAVGHETDTTLIDLAADRRAPTPTAAAEMAVPVRAELMAALADREARRLRAMARGLDLRRQRLTDLARALPRPMELIESRQQRLDAVQARMPRPADLIEARRQRLATAVARMPRPQSLTAERRAMLSVQAYRLPEALRGLTQRHRLTLGRVSAGLSPAVLAARTERLRDRLADRAGRLAPAAARMAERRRDRVSGLARVLNTLGYKQTLARGYAVVRDAGGAVVTDGAGLAPGTRLGVEFRDATVPVLTTSPGGETPRPAKAKRPAKPQTSLFDDP